MVIEIITGLTMIFVLVMLSIFRFDANFASTAYPHVCSAGSAQEWPNGGTASLVDFF